VHGAVCTVSPRTRRGSSFRPRSQAVEENAAERRRRLCVVPIRMATAIEVLNVALVARSPRPSCVCGRPPTGRDRRVQIQSPAEIRRGRDVTRLSVTAAAAAPHRRNIVTQPNTQQLRSHLHHHHCCCCCCCCCCGVRWLASRDWVSGACRRSPAADREYAALTTGVDGRVRSTSLYHCRQCSVVLKRRSDRIGRYTVVWFVTHDCSRNTVRPVRAECGLATVRALACGRSVVPRAASRCRRCCCCCCCCCCIGMSRQSDAGTHVTTHRVDAARLLQLQYTQQDAACSLASNPASTWHPPQSSGRAAPCRGPAADAGTCAKYRTPAAPHCTLR